MATSHAHGEHAHEDHEKDEKSGWSGHSEGFPKLDVRVEYCVPCGYALRAAYVAGEIMEFFPNDIASWTLVPAGHGSQNVYFNGVKVIDHMDPERQSMDPDDPRRTFDARTMMALVREWREGVGRPVTKRTGARVDKADQDIGVNFEDPQFSKTRPHLH